MQQPLELILTRQWASHMNYPVWLYNDQGLLIYYNEPAEKILEIPFEACKSWTSKDLIHKFKYESDDGKEVAWESLPINIALYQHRPSHRLLTLRSFNGLSRQIEIAAFPIMSQEGKQLGAVSIFWENPRL